MTKTDVTHAVSAAFAGLAIALQLIVVALLVLALVAIFVPVARRPLRALGGTIAGGEIWLAWGIALAATLGSLFFSEYADFIPCRLCWIYIENHPEAESAGCTIGAPCSTKWIDEFGYVTIPTLAITAFAAILTLLIFALRRTRVARARA